MSNSGNNTISIVLPTYNESQNIVPLIKKLLELSDLYELELIVVDDNSHDGTTTLVREISQKDKRIRLLYRIDRSGLSSAIKEGILNATGQIIAVMDSDGQHEPNAIIEAVKELNINRLDLVIGSRFLKNSKLKGLSSSRKKGSALANNLARLSLNKNYRNITDFMSGCFVLKSESCLPFINTIDVHGFKFLYELLSISNGQLKIKEIAINFKSRLHGTSKLDIAILWDFIISLLHTISGKLLPRRAVSFALVGLSGIFVQLIATEALIRFTGTSFESVLPFSVVIAASSNYLINNFLTFRGLRLKNWDLVKGLLKFLIVASLPVMANIGLATSFYNYITPSELLAQVAGILVVFIWNYAASSRFVWNTPS